ncbi:MAG: tRNA uridine-5-carboxymethylaminomethyl(34) synthesis GTPase MnmE [Gammaproteobacteria bacterium]|nr:tRNA uridine-5-carboxymethylaminomethyl(34) synthesis GTPase MnmE [Gammaproteobacteria bacterium]
MKHLKNLIDNSTDTIVAQATPPGRGGISIIRLSGPSVKSISEKILHTLPHPRTATHTSFYDEENIALDEGIAIFFPQPNSFTGEDVLELQGHGGPAVVDLLIQHILKLGVRMAHPGEFSERAYLNDKLDLAQAEAIADLIDASSSQAARAAMRSLQGEFSKRIHELVEKITHLRMYVEAAIDFAEEEIDFLADNQVATDLTNALTDLESILASATQGSLLREGITVVIAGEPNVGKSSLLNCLSGKESAIVTNIPGTTRDVLREYILLDGLPLHIIDTAGLRESDDLVEQEGMRRARHEISQADILLEVIDATSSSSLHQELNCEIPKSADRIIVRNKIDLINEVAGIEKRDDKTIISLSAKNNIGIDILKNHIKSCVGFAKNTEGCFSARRRHLDALIRAKDFLLSGQEQLADHRAGELLAEDLRQAQIALSEITGEFTSDDLLGRIFSSFCVGK